MKVFKFGGASVKDAEAVKNVAKIVGQFQQGKLMIVVSAMGKTTNALEGIVNSYIASKEDLPSRVSDLKRYHNNIIKELFNEVPTTLTEDLEKIFGYLEKRISIVANQSFDLIYDQIVPVGELLSTKIISAYLNFADVKNTWLDARKIILTDGSFRKANVDWELTQFTIDGLEWENEIFVTQGFIGGTKGNFMTTLGREGSDYTGAILANCLNAKSLTIWKDVEGVLNADPKFFNNTEKLDQISFKEAIELAYYGASVIHPKTIKPLQNKNIPLYVKSFVNPAEEGTKISEDFSKDGLIPCFIFKTNQCLVSFSTKDFSFVAEEQISELFQALHKFGFEVTAMQNSAINFSVNTTFNEEKLKLLIEELKEKYSVKYNSNLDLMTIRHYNEDIIKELTKGRKVLLQQRSRNTVKLIMS